MNKYGRQPNFHEIVFHVKQAEIYDIWLQSVREFQAVCLHCACWLISKDSVLWINLNSYANFQNRHSGHTQTNSPCQAPLFYWKILVVRLTFHQKSSILMQKLMKGHEYKSVPLTIFGLNGGFTRLPSRASQSMSRKNGWFLMAASVPWAATQPKRLAGFFVMNCQ